MEKENKKDMTLQPKVEKRWFKGYKNFIKAFKKKVTYYYVGEKFKPGSFILSNHESTKGPLAWDFYCDQAVRLLGTEEMNSGLKRMYKYQSEIYYHEKKHWNLFGAKMFCLLASPMTNLFYKGLDLISIRAGMGFRETISDCYIAMNEFKESLVYFPENSEDGYLANLKGLKLGFVLICDYCLKKGYDIPMVPAYFRKTDNVMIVDEPIMYSKLKEKYETREAIADALKDRMNELGRMDVSTLNKA